MKKVGIVRTIRMAFLGAAILISWQAMAENPAATSSPRATISASNDSATPRKETPDFLSILQTVEQLENQIPTRSELISKLRGQLFRYERQTQREKYGLLAQLRKNSLHSADSRLAAQPRPLMGDWQRDPEPGTDLYTPCQGLSDKSLIQKLREISEYQVGLDYREARRQMFTKLDNVNGEVECVYTGRKEHYNSLPNDRDMNCEHTWPQSQGAVGIAKSDLHHLFPTDSSANSTRGSLPFGQVSAAWAEGGSECDGDVFEIRPEHRGNAARAKFYFAVRYGKQIGRDEEATLREWNKEDPVDEAEKKRNDGIENLQHNRNPFIDHPEFIDRIADF